MQNSTEYILFIKDFVENILLSLNCDYNKYISFKKNSCLAKKIHYKGIDNILSNIAYNLLINGKQQIYLYSKDNKILISLSNYKDKILIRKFKIQFPTKVMTTFKRKKILITLGKMVYPNNDKFMDKDYVRNNLFIMTLMRHRSLKLTKNYVSVNAGLEKCTDQYILFREIRKRKYQKMLVNHILDKLNKQLHKALKINDKTDNIIFVSQSLEEMDEIEKDLLNNKKTIDEVQKILYPKPSK